MNRRKFTEWMLGGYEYITLKFMFEHVRNIGLCAFLMGVGFYLIQDDTGSAIIRGFVAVWGGWFVITVGGILMLLNSGQFLMVGIITISQFPKWLFLILAVPLTLWLNTITIILLFGQLRRLLA